VHDRPVDRYASTSRVISGSRSDLPAIGLAPPPRKSTCVSITRSAEDSKCGAWRRHSTSGSPCGHSSMAVALDDRSPEQSSRLGRQPTCLDRCRKPSPSTRREHPGGPGLSAAASPVASGLTAMPYPGSFPPTRMNTGPRASGARRRHLDPVSRQSPSASPDIPSP
jgi:hypothetical protein